MLAFGVLVPTAPRCSFKCINQYAVVSVTAIPAPRPTAMTAMTATTAMTAMTAVAVTLAAPHRAAPLNPEAAIMPSHNGSFFLLIQQLTPRARPGLSGPPRSWEED